MNDGVTTFTEQDRQLIVALTSKLTGASPEAQPKLEACLVNIRRRMTTTGAASLIDYLGIVEESLDELAHFISAVTIHTTSWFREKPHYERLQQLATTALEQFQQGKRKEPFRILSAGCSTGEEAYSMALLLEDMRLAHPEFDYTIEGWDVDLISVAKGTQAVYSATGLKDIPAPYHRHLLVGTGDTKGFFTFDRSIRERCTFVRRSLMTSQSGSTTQFDLIFCRNVLIYFSLDAVKEIVTNLIALLKPGSHLCLGHSEGIEADKFGLAALGNTTYRKVSALESAAKATTGTKARSTGKKTEPSRPDLILIGSSTGGTEVLVKLLQDLPQPCPPVMVVQHIAHSFSQVFAERLAAVSGLELARMDVGQPLLQNHLYMALGDYHISVKWRGGLCLLDTSRQPPIHSVRPAVDVLFHSALDTAKNLNVHAVILTGMGKDGATGLAALRSRGATTLVQDEASSTVFGMPREAIALGGAEFVGNPAQIRQRLLAALKLKSSAA